MNDRDIYRQMPLGRHFAQIGKLYFGALSRALDHMDLDRYYSILILLDKSGKPINQQYIANFLQIDKATMVRVIDQLEKQEYITRISNPEDRREHLIKLTPKAALVLPEIHATIQKLNAVAFEGISSEQRENFGFVLETIWHNLAKEPTMPIIISYKKHRVGSKQE